MHQTQAHGTAKRGLSRTMITFKNSRNTLNTSESSHSYGIEFTKVSSFCGPHPLPCVFEFCFDFVRSTERCAARALRIFLSWDHDVNRLLRPIERQPTLARWRMANRSFCLQPRWQDVRRHRKLMCAFFLQFLIVLLLQPQAA